MIWLWLALAAVSAMFGAMLLVCLLLGWLIAMIGKILQIRP
jgi:hypothetical protein